MGVMIDHPLIQESFEKLPSGTFTSLESPPSQSSPIKGEEGDGGDPHPNLLPGREKGGDGEGPQLMNLKDSQEG